MSYVRPNLNEIVAEMPKVQARVKVQADLTAVRIKAMIAPHNRTGNLFHSVKVERSFKGKDQWVHVNASYAGFVNFGFYNHPAQRHIQGIHFIKGAIYAGHSAHA